MSKKGKPAAFLFSKGDRVRVKAGVRDPDFPDMPLGGWAGTVEEVEKGRPVSYLVRWDRRTLDAIHPVFRSRCERDGLEVERMSLAEEDLEPDAGGPAPIEQPTQIVTKPLDPKDQDDRLRAIFRLTHDDLLPEMDEESLRAFRDHLSARLAFPFEAEFSEETGPFSGRTRAVTVTGLPAEEEYLDEHYGLICDAREGKKHVQFPLSEVEVKKGSPNRQLLADYSYWFWNWR